MLVVISPAKKLNFEDKAPVEEFSIPQFLDKTQELVAKLKTCSAEDLSQLMKLSPALGELNYERYQKFKSKYDLKNSKQSVFAFNGDTYQGLDIDSFNKSDLKYANSHLRILSGLYGILRPLDLIQPYRLEMGTRFGIAQAKNLYDVWRDEVTAYLNSELKKEKVLVNLASQEYFGAVNEKAVEGKIITPVFKEKKNGVLKIISFNAKKARGSMSRYIIKNRIKSIDDLKKFDLDDYKYSASLSSETQFVFTR